MIRITAILTRLGQSFTRTINILTTTILLTLVFFCIVLPTGLIRRIAGADPLQRRQFKRSRHSVLATRNHTYIAENLKNLF